MLSGSTIFVIMIFVTVLLLFQGMVVPVFGESAAARKRLQKRLAAIEGNDPENSFDSILRKKYLKKLSPLEQVLEDLLQGREFLQVFLAQDRVERVFRVVALNRCQSLLQALARCCRFAENRNDHALEQEQHGHEDHDDENC